MRGLFEQQLVAFPRALHTSVKSLSKTLKLGKYHYHGIIITPLSWLFNKNVFPGQLEKYSPKYVFFVIINLLSHPFQKCMREITERSGPHCYPRCFGWYQLCEGFFSDRFQGEISDCKNINIHLGQLVIFSSVFVDLPFNLVRPNFSTTPKKKIINPSIIFIIWGIVRKSRYQWSFPLKEE